MKYLPSPESFYAKTNNGSSFSVTSTPYDTTEWKDVVHEYGIKLPEVIDMTLGKSKCYICGAIYAGYQPNCTAIIYFSKQNDKYYKEKGISGEGRLFFDECKGSIIWELSEEFEKQRSFFSLLSRISNLPSTSHDPFVRFDEFFPKGVTEELRKRILSQDVEKITPEIVQIKLALNQIAQKMNSAGACLSFGF